MRRKRFVKLLMADRMNNPRGTGKRTANEIAETVRKSPVFESYKSTFEFIKQIEKFHGRIIRICVIGDTALFYTTSGICGVFGTPGCMDNQHQKEQ